MAAVALVLFVNWESPPASPECTKEHGMGKALAGFAHISTKIHPNTFHLVRNALQCLWELFLVLSHLPRSF